MGNRNVFKYSFTFFLYVRVYLVLIYLEYL